MLLTPAGVSRDTLRRWTLRARRRLRLPGRIVINAITPSISQRLNRRYRRRRRATNVLTFDYAHDPRARSADPLAGEVLLCPAVIRREAQHSGTPYRGRLRMLLEHGLIHLLGFDHATAADQRRWERYEQRLT